MTSSILCRNCFLVSSELTKPSAKYLSSDGSKVDLLGRKTPIKKGEMGVWQAREEEMGIWWVLKCAQRVLKEVIGVLAILEEERWGKQKRTREKNRKSEVENLLKTR